MKRKFIYSLMLLLFFILAACGTQPTPQATPTLQQDPGTGALVVQMLQQNIAMQATQQAMGQAIAANEARITATQMAVMATVTEQARIDQQAMIRSEATSTERVWEVTQQAAIVQATSTAAAQATSGSISATHEAAAWNAQATAQAAQAENAVIVLQKTQMTYGVTAWGPWVIALLALMAAGYVIWKKSQVGVIPTDASGRYQVMVVEHNGQKTVIMPDRMASPVLALRDDVSAPMLTDTETQKAAT